MVTWRRDGWVEVVGNDGQQQTSLLVTFRHDEQMPPTEALPEVAGRVMAALAAGTVVVVTADVVI